jgi:rhodanese-related sulfurtransferase
MRSLNAAVFLAAQGWTDVVSLAGGIDAWSQEVDPSLPRY